MIKISELQKLVTYNCRKCRVLTHQRMLEMLKVKSTTRHRDSHAGFVHDFSFVDWTDTTAECILSTISADGPFIKRNTAWSIPGPDHKIVVN